ncbi:MAG TPA: hypothetical protein VH186_07105 [Chloroflexia bacterium]|nr:hypothetical protein [Chloroflexia bacterium]
MRKTLYEVSLQHSIPANTLRVAIHRGLLDAEKVGHIRMIDDEGESFKKYLAQYNARQTASHSPSVSNKTSAKGAAESS